MKKSNKLATVIAYGDETLFMEFSPGLPYDPQTKGMAHRRVAA